MFCSKVWVAYFQKFKIIEVTGLHILCYPFLMYGLYNYLEGFKIENKSTLTLNSYKPKINIQYVIKIKHNYNQ